MERELARRADQRVLRLIGHVERADEYRMARRVLKTEVSGGRVRYRPRFSWMDGVKVVLGNRGMTVEAARQRAKDQKSREPWYTCLALVPILAWPCVLSDRPPVFWWVSPEEGWNAVT